MDESLTARLKDEARRLGFTAAGVCPAVAPPGLDRFRRWLEAGYAGRMDYLPGRAAAYEHPRHVLEGVRSLLMLAMNYRTTEPREPAAGEGRISRYAWGEADYHDIIHRRLNSLAAWLQQQAPGARVRGVVDTAPLLEREFARLAGLGWTGKHTLLINPREGSYFFLAALLTDLELPTDRPFEADHCGSCTACLDACPTDAFPQPYVLDASRCISYLTIELREAMPVELRRGVGDWLFGCDICQDVCPWNRKMPMSTEPPSSGPPSSGPPSSGPPSSGPPSSGPPCSEPPCSEPPCSGPPCSGPPCSGPQFTPVAELDPVDAVGLFHLDDEAFRRRFRRSPLWRSRRRGILRNAAVVLGNRPAPASVAALVVGLGDEEPLVRGACAWALGRNAAPQARAALEARGEIEQAAEVQAEISAALNRREGDSPRNPE